MSRTASPWRGAGLLLLLGGLFSGSAVLGDDEPSMTSQLADLGRQALAQGANRAAESFFKQALELDPKNQDASDGLAETKRANKIVLVAMQDPADAKPAEEAKPAQDPAQPKPAPATDTPPPPPPGDTKATLEQAQAAERITRQQLTDSVEQRIKTAQGLMNQNQPEAAMNALRLSLNVIRSATDAPEDVRTKLERRVQAELMAIASAEERIVSERARAHPA